jgi:16S rRNA (guanine527-N7)-methyltransferase
MMQQLYAYFDSLSEAQKQQFLALPQLYQSWNEKINLISRQDMDNLVERHILHALAIAKCISFKPETKVLDLGTGGGFPGIPLSILFPEVEFLLIDGTGKKIAVVQDIIQHLQLNNVKAFQARAEDLGMPKKFDFVVSRAVAPLDKLLQWSRPLLSQKHKNAYPNGLFALKGGDLKAEIQALPGKGSAYTECIPISSFFKEAFFKEKWVVYVQG